MASMNNASMRISGWLQVGGGAAFAGRGGILRKFA
jgi:hypothetical protein